jgi:S-adenosylmethionine/arginine decarboxylase-like enzyme
MVEFALDLINVPRDLCLDDERVLETMVKALKNHGAHIINASRYHCGHKSPPGIICMVTIDESFCYCHSYADRNEMALNIFTCGHIDTEGVLKEITSELNLDIKNSNVHKIDRFIK